MANVDVWGILKCRVTSSGLRTAASVAIDVVHTVDRKHARQNSVKTSAA